MLKQATSSCYYNSRTQHAQAALAVHAGTATTDWLQSYARQRWHKQHDCGCTDYSLLTPNGHKHCQFEPTQTPLPARQPSQTVSTSSLASNPPAGIPTAHSRAAACCLLCFELAPLLHIPVEDTGHADLCDGDVALDCFKVLSNLLQAAFTRLQLSGQQLLCLC